MRGRFAHPAEDTIYLDGNSIGAMPADALERVQRAMIEGWRDARRRSWSRFDWLEKPWLLGAGLAHILGAGHDDVVFCDSTSVNLFKILAYAWQLDRARPFIVTEAHNFPTDMYIAQGLERFVGAELRRISRPEELDAALRSDVGVLYLSHVDYRSSRRWDMAAINRKARAAGMLTLWDCSHSAGAVPVDLGGTGADFAVGCGYKYLCGGPGAPAWLYVHPRHQDRAWPVIAGWMGHADVAAFGPHYEPARGVRRQLTGSPAILANEAMAAAIDLWKEVKREDLAWKHRSLSDVLVALLEQECANFGVDVTSPRNYNERGGHVTIRHEGAGSVTEALLASGVVSSFRKPDWIRFGVQPLALSHEDVWIAVRRLRQVLESEAWRDARFAKVSI
jgi:kynureninase